MLLSDDQCDLHFVDLFHAVPPCDIRSRLHNTKTRKSLERDEIAPSLLILNSLFVTSYAF